MIFLIWPEEMAFSCSWYHISAQSLWDGCLLLSLLRQADGAAVCQFMRCIHVSQSRWTLRQNRDLSRKPSSKSIFFLFQSSFYWFHKEVKIKGFWLKQSREITSQNFSEVMEDSLKRQQNEPWTLLSEFVRFWHANPPVLNVQAEGKLDEPKQRIRFPLHSLVSFPWTARSKRPGLGS